MAEGQQHALEKEVAIVAGATRGAGRGIAAGSCFQPEQGLRITASVSASEVGRCKSVSITH